MSIAPLLILSASILGAACAPPLESASYEPQAKGSKRTTVRPPSDAPTPPTTDFVTLKDPVENAHTIGMPKGWKNLTYTARIASIATSVDVSTSPNGSVVIFQGDPSLPQYWSPDQALPVHYDLARFDKKVKIERFVPATEYFPAYVRRKFGKLPNFKLTGMTVDKAEQNKFQSKFEAAGLRGQVTLATLNFSYTDGARPMRAMIYGFSMNNTAGFWSVGVAGISTSGDPKAYVKMMEAMGKTRKMNPQWQAEQQRKHEATMAQIQRFGQQMTANHNANMARIQQSAQSHQARMSAIQAQGDASMSNYYSRMASGDVQQRNFLNYINDESTVASSSGKTYQVDNSYGTYFRHTRNNSYVGGDTHMTRDDLRKLGLNPDDYEQLKRSSPN